eukprot:5415354-Amphidinium_carterae.1
MRRTPSLELDALLPQFFHPVEEFNDPSIQPTIPGSVGRCLIQRAMGPDEKGSRPMCSQMTSVSFGQDQINTWRQSR